MQVDNAPGFQTLSLESNSQGSVMYRYHIKIDLGRPFNKNKNPVAENGIKEFHKECLRLNTTGGPLTPTNLAIVTKTMNERIRDRGFTSKEILLQRDQMLNTARPISDDFLSQQQLKNRTERHPTNPTLGSNSFVVGQNVLLRDGKSKLKGRELYKVISVFLKEGEPWVTIQKCENQFRTKEYNVKTSEIIPWIKKDEDVLITPLPPIQEDDMHKNDNGSPKEYQLSSKVEKSLDIEPIADTCSSSYSDRPTKRPARKTALRAQKLIRDMATNSVLNVNKEKKCPPLHAWDWEAFQCLVEADADIMPRTYRFANSSNRYSTDDADTSDQPSLDTDKGSDNYVWDDSPEQYQLQETDNKGMPARRKLFAERHSPATSLTETPSDDDVFPTDKSTSSNRRFKRCNPVKKRMKRRSRNDLVTLSPSNDEDSHAADISPMLSPIPNLRPLSTNDVLLGSRVQYLDAPLNEIQQSIRTQIFTRRSSRRNGPRFDYKHYDKFGDKNPKF